MSTQSVVPFFEYINGVHVGLLPALVDVFAQELFFTYDIIPVNDTVTPWFSQAFGLNLNFMVTYLNFFEDQSAYIASIMPAVAAQLCNSQCNPLGFDLNDDGIYTQDEVMDRSAQLFQPSGSLVSTEYAGIVWKEYTGSNKWAFLQPFESSLWYATLVTILVASVVLTLIEYIWTPNKDTTYRITLPGFARIVYHMLTSQIGGEDYEWFTAPGRILRVGILLFSLVLSNTCTRTTRPKPRHHAESGPLAAARAYNPRRFMFGAHPLWQMSPTWPPSSPSRHSTSTARRRCRNWPRR